MKGPVVLVVEDNEQNLELVDYLLEEAGFVVRAARDAAAARTSLAEEWPSLVLLDVNLPGEDGLSLAAWIRSTPNGGTLPVVALTALAMRGDRERILEHGFSGYIAKPIEPARFVAQVKGYLPPSLQHIAERG